jgi:7-keto-8-aminopelargonate synthetase-like enzyme
MTTPEPLRNTRSMMTLAAPSYARAVDNGLMRVSLKARNGKRVTLADGREATEFVSCSYLGLDDREDVIAAGKKTLDEWGLHLCCARSRFTIGPNTELEAALSELWGGRAITFPSVTAAHMSTMPLLATEAFGQKRGHTTFLYDRFAHASMQYLKPVLAAENHVETLPHNDLQALEDAVKAAHARGDSVVYVADGVYSMGGFCPIEEVMAMSRRLDFLAYVDDAHGTSIYGARGEGSVLSQLGGRVPEGLVIPFSLSKGFGCNGGGVLLPNTVAESAVRTYGMTYAFSAPLDFSVVGAALRVVELHRDGTVARLQQQLQENVARFDRLTGRDEPFGPIRMVRMGDDETALSSAEKLLASGHFVTVTFFPIVPRGEAQLRLCITARHTPEQLEAVAAALKSL